MKISDICIKRPVLAWVMTLIITIVGLVCYTRLPIQYFPKFEHPIITVETQLPGASAEVVEQSVTRVIEEAVSTIDGIANVSSTSQTQESKVQIEFTPSKNIDSAVNDIRDKVAKTKPDLPPEHQPSVITRSASDSTPIIALVLMGKKFEIGELAEFARNEIEKELESIPGVAQVLVTGSGNYVMHVYLDPIKLASQNITVDEVMQAIKRHNFEKPGGTIRTGDREYVVTTVSNLEKPIQFENMAIVERGNHIVKIRDVGYVEMTPEEKRTRSRFNGERVISVLVYKQSTANPLAIANSVYEKLPILKQKLKEGMEINIGVDNTRYIKKSIHEVYKSIFEAIIFVTFVVLIFLQSFRASIIPLVTIPVSLIGTFTLMYILDFSINIMTLMALVLAIGLVVDDAIVVLENTYRYMEKGMSALKASYQSIKEVGFAVIAMTLTLVAVYAPISLAQGITGKILIEFAITLAFAVILSGFVAITLSPMMCSRILTHNKKSNESWFFTKFQKKFPIELWIDDLAKIYKNYLIYVLKNKGWALLSSFIFALLCLGLFMVIPKGLWPKEDRGIIKIEGEAPQTATVEFTDEQVKKLDLLLSEIPDIEKRQTTIENANSYKINITLKDKKRRKTEDVMKVIESKFNEVTGINARINSASDTAEADFVQFAIRGNKEVKQLVTYATGILYPSLIQTGLFVGGPLTSQKGEQEQFVITIDPKVDILKIDPRTIAETIESLIRGSKSTSFRKSGRLYDVMVEKKDVRSIDDIKRIFVRARDPKKDNILIPISELVDIQPKMGFPNITHYNRTRSVDQKYKLRMGISVSQAIQTIQNSAKEYLPDDIYLEFIGDTKRYLTEKNIMLMIFFLAICFIYLILAAQFESWRDPFIILFSVPLSLAGGLIAISLTKNPVITIYGNIGFVTLIGLITKHGIMMVDFANKLREEGDSKINAIVKASQLRLRPILMTTFAMILGVFPMVIATGASSESRNELGLVITGGLLIGTFLTLFIIPCVYIILSKNKIKKQQLEIPH